MPDLTYLEQDGYRLSYMVEGAGTPVLLIQGVGVHGEGWRPQLEALIPEHRCLWYDTRGLGHSQPPAHHLSVQRLAGDAWALMTAQRWDSAHLIGHSLGGLIALCLAFEHHTAVRSLSLLCTFARGLDAGASRRMVWLGLRTRFGTRRQRRAAFLEILASPGNLVRQDRDGLAQDMAALFGHDLADHPAAEKTQLAAMRRYDATPSLGRLSGIPTLVVSAAHDPIAPPVLGQALAEGIPGARFVLLPDAAHGAPILAANTVNSLLLKHLASVDKVRPPS